MRRWAAWAALAAGLPLAAAAQLPADATGRRFPPHAAVRRVISLAPSLTEEVYDLQADGALVADTIYCNYPAGAAAKTKIGTILTPNLERIVALHPDLVLANMNANRAATVEQLRRLGLRVYAMPPAAHFTDIAAQFRTLAQLLGRAAAGEAVLRQAEAQVAAERTRVAGHASVRTFFVVQQTPLVSASDATYIGEILRDAGAANVEGDNAAPYPPLSAEAVLAANPEAILVDDEQAAPRQAVAYWLRFPGLAARNRRVYTVPSHLFDTPTPTTFAAAVRKAAELLHPEAAGEP